MSDTVKQEDLVNVAMQIILHAGDSRVKITEALKYAKKFDFANAGKAMDEAEKEIVLAHKAQTDVIQAEADGEKYEYSLLFNHAQDTLMTINSEVRMAKELIAILRIISEKR